MIQGLLDIDCSSYVMNIYSIYNRIESQTKNKEIICPNCKCSVSMHGWYSRKVILSELEVIKVNIIQVKCKKCKKVHAVIPGFISPKKQYSAHLIVRAISEHQNCSADDSTIRRWRKMYE